MEMQPLYEWGDKTDDTQTGQGMTTDSDKAGMSTLSSFNSD